MRKLSVTDPTAETFLGYVDTVRLESARKLDPSRRATLGQFFTSTSIARLMASLSSFGGETVRLLDPCAGMGVLAAAWICTACDTDAHPACIEVIAYEIDELLIDGLRRVLDQAREYAETRGVVVRFTIRNEDFIRSAVQQITGGIFCSGSPSFDIAILNPPYGKFRTDSPERRLLREVGVETSNLYTAFVALSLRIVASGGELIAITPRSFCNGPYFTPFRRDLLRLGSLTHVHVFDSRNTAFGEDEVLQENIVFRVVRGRDQNEFVNVEWSTSGHLLQSERREVPFSQVVRAEDDDAFIHIAPDHWDSHIAEMVRALRGSLSTLDLQVSTGRVVDFRVKEFLRADPAEDTVPLIYPGHFFNNSIAWPIQGSKKPNALVRTTDTQAQLNPSGTYVLVKRFSAKEERRRIVAAVLDPSAIIGEFVAFENHLN
jgi:adenine-specific DNA-methyltransferase